MAATDRGARSATPAAAAAIAACKATSTATHYPAVPPVKHAAPRSPAGALLAAALALPGVVPGGAGAQSAPDSGSIELKVLDYRDWQPGANRMSVKSPSFHAVAPLSDTLVVEGSVVYDSMSGASPLYHHTLSGASGLGVTDYRTAGDVKVTRYLDGMAIAVGGAGSSERDYSSRAGSLEVRVFSADRNRTWVFVVGGANDRITPVNGLVVNAPRNTVDFLVGVAQALSPTSTIQSNLTYSSGHGYYSDPYKPLDTRPGRRSVLGWLTRYNEHFPAMDGTLRLSGRYLHDSFGTSSAALEAAWFQPLPAGWSVAPGLRYYTQSAAHFYFNPPFPQGYVPGRDYTADTRLSAFGALTPAVSIAKAFPEGWSATVKLAFYRQRAGWQLAGNGSPGLEPFSARWIEAGVAKSF